MNTQEELAQILQEETAHEQQRNRLRQTLEEVAERVQRILDDPQTVYRGRDGDFYYEMIRLLAPGFALRFSQLDTPGLIRATKKLLSFLELIEANEKN